MGFMYEVRCEGCGYQVMVLEGAGFRGLSHPRACRDCRTVVMLWEEHEHLRDERMYREGVPPDEIERRLAEPLEERCPECGGDRLKSWTDGNQEARDDDGLPLTLDPCPKCAGAMRPAGHVGIWD